MFEPLEEDVPSEIEDGEISDFDEYTPLERPPLPALVQNDVSVPEAMPQSPSDSDNNDSDEDPIAKIKRHRIEPQANSNPNNKYKIWSQSLQDEALAENLGSCEVGEKSDFLTDGRNVENYNYRLKYQDEEKVGLKRRHDSESTTNGNSKDLRHKLGRRPSHPHSEERIIMPLKHNEESSDQDLADDIANKLLEVESDLVLRTVQLAGKKDAIRFFEKTKEIEKSGGMWLEAQKRRRTPGGIFFFLLKNDRHLPQAVIKSVFDDPKKRIIEKQKKQMNKRRKKMERAQKNRELKKKLQDELSILSANVQNSKSSEGDSNPPPSPVSEPDQDEEKMESD